MRYIKHYCLFISLLVTGCSDSLWGCGRDISSIQKSPDGKFAIINVHYNCGASSSITRLHYMVENSEIQNIGDDPYKLKRNRMFLKTEKGRVKTEWAGENKVNVGHTVDVEIFVERKNLGIISFDYYLIPE